MSPPYQTHLIFGDLLIFSVFDVCCIITLSLRWRKLWLIFVGAVRQLKIALWGDRAKQAPCACYMESIRLIATFSVKMEGEGRERGCARAKKEIGEKRIVWKAGREVRRIEEKSGRGEGKKRPNSKSSQPLLLQTDRQLELLQGSAVRIQLHKSTYEPTGVCVCVCEGRGAEPEV